MAFFSFIFIKLKRNTDGLFGMFVFFNDVNSTQRQLNSVTSYYVWSTFLLLVNKAPDERKVLVISIVIMEKAGEQWQIKYQIL